MLIRRASVADLNLLVKLRMDYTFDGKPYPDESDATPIRENLTSYFQKWLPSDSFLALFAEEEGEILSTAFLSIAERPPRSTASCRIGTVYNVYTYPQHRRKGIATKVLQALMQEAQSLNLSTVDLLASAAGKPLYESLGFRVSEHVSMQIRL